MSILAPISSALFGRNSQCSSSSPCHLPFPCKSATSKETFSGQKGVLGPSTNDKQELVNTYSSFLAPGIGQPCDVSTSPLRGLQQDWAPVAHTCNLLINANMLVSLLFLSNCSFWSHPSNKLLALKTLSEGLLLENWKLRHLSTKASGGVMLVKQARKVQAEAQLERQRYRPLVWYHLKPSGARVVASVWSWREKQAADGEVQPSWEGLFVNQMPGYLS